MNNRKRQLSPPGSPPTYASQPSQVINESPQLDTLPEPEINDAENRINSTRMVVIMENEKLRRRNYALSMTLAKMEAEINQMKNALNDTHRELTKFRYAQIRNNNLFELFLRDVSNLGDRYRTRMVTQFHNVNIMHSESVSSSSST